MDQDLGEYDPKAGGRRGHRAGSVVGASSKSLFNPSNAGAFLYSLQIGNYSPLVSGLQVIGLALFSTRRLNYVNASIQLFEV